MTQRGFSAIELIGALAIVVILTALLLPKLAHRSDAPKAISTINNARITEAVVAIQSLQTAVATHLAHFGSLASINGTPLRFAENYDQFGQILLTEGLIDRPFDLKLGTHSTVRLLRVSGLSASSPLDGANGAYDLDGDGRNDVVGTPFLVEAVLPGVEVAEARAVNDQVEGPGLGENPQGDDFRGRVVYRKPGPDGRTELHVYIIQGR